MEGYGVLRAAQDAGVPALEVRVVSNEVEEQDRARWMFSEALGTLHAMLPGSSRRSPRARAELRLLALPQRHVRVPRRSCTGWSTATCCVRAVAARHRGAEPRGPHGELELTQDRVGALRSARRSLPAAARGRRPRPRRRAARRGSRGRVARRRGRGRIADPGLDTTAFLLLRLAAPALGDVVELRYDRILDAVASGEVDAGLIIHESRFTYPDHGLTRVADLGEWWEGETGLPVPLAAICARATSMPSSASGARARAAGLGRVRLRAPEASREYVRAHSQELSDDVCDQHIALYVNEFSIDLGDDGMRAIEALTARSGARS